MKTVIPEDKKVVLKEMYEQGMNSKGKSCEDKQVEAAQKTGLDLQVIKDWIGNHRKVKNNRKYPQKRLTCTYTKGMTSFNAFVRENKDKFSSINEWAPAWQAVSEDNKKKYKEKAKEAMGIPDDDKNKIIKKLMNLLEHNVRELQKHGVDLCVIGIDKNDGSQVMMGFGKTLSFLETRTSIQHELYAHHSINANVKSEHMNRKDLQQNVQSHMNHLYHKATGENRFPYKKVAERRINVYGIPDILLPLRTLSNYGEKNLQEFLKIKEIVVEKCSPEIDNEDGGDDDENHFHEQDNSRISDSGNGLDDEELLLDLLVPHEEEGNIATLSPPAHSSTQTKTPPAHPSTHTKTAPAHSPTQTKAPPAHSSTHPKSAPAILSSNNETALAHSFTHTKTLPAHSSTHTQAPPAHSFTHTKTLSAHTSTHTKTAPAISSTHTKTPPANSSTKTQTTQSPPAHSSTHTKTAPAHSPTHTNTPPAHLSTHTKAPLAHSSTHTKTAPAVSSTHTKTAPAHSPTHTNTAPAHLSTHTKAPLAHSSTHTKTAPAVSSTHTKTATAHSHTHTKTPQVNSSTCTQIPTTQTLSTEKTPTTQTLAQETVSNHTTKNKSSDTLSSKKRRKPMKSGVIKNKKAKAYIVDEILEVKEKEGKRHYLIHWKGYPKSEDSWEPEENISPVLIGQYLSNKYSK